MYAVFQTVQCNMRWNCFYNNCEDVQWGENRQQSNTIFMRRELDESSMYAGYSKRLIWRQINKRINAVNVMKNFLVQSNYMRILCVYKYAMKWDNG